RRGRRRRGWACGSTRDPERHRYPHRHHHLAAFVLTPCPPLVVLTPCPPLAVLTPCPPLRRCGEGERYTRVDDQGLRRGEPRYPRSTPVLISVAVANSPLDPGRETIPRRPLLRSRRWPRRPPAPREVR